jgi:hypothetical protein
MFFVQILNEGQIWLDGLLQVQPRTVHASLYSLLSLHASLTLLTEVRDIICD